MVKQLGRIGVQKFTLRADSEPAIMEVARKAAEKLNNGTIIEQTARASHASLGGVERYHQTLHAQIRTLRGQLAKNVGAEVFIDSALFMWLARHAASGLNRFQLWKGDTPHHRINGYIYAWALAHFGERVLVREPAAETTVKLKARRLPAF